MKQLKLFEEPEPIEKIWFGLDSMSIRQFAERLGFQIQQKYPEVKDMETRRCGEWWQGRK